MTKLTGQIHLFNFNIYFVSNEMNFFEVTATNLSNYKHSDYFYSDGTTNEDVKNSLINYIAGQLAFVINEGKLNVSFNDWKEAAKQFVNMEFELSKMFNDANYYDEKKEMLDRYGNIIDHDKSHLEKIRFNELNDLLSGVKFKINCLKVVFFRLVEQVILLIVFKFYQMFICIYPKIHLSMLIIGRFSVN